jgi:hypothetical protein
MVDAGTVVEVIQEYIYNGKVEIFYEDLIL